MAMDGPMDGPQVTDPEKLSNEALDRVLSHFHGKEQLLVDGMWKAYGSKPELQDLLKGVSQAAMQLAEGRAQRLLVQPNIADETTSDDTSTSDDEDPAAAAAAEQAAAPAGEAEGGAAAGGGGSRPSSRMGTLFKRTAKAVGGIKHVRPVTRPDQLDSALQTQLDEFRKQGLPVDIIDDDVLRAMQWMDPGTVARALTQFMQLHGGLGGPSGGFETAPESEMEGLDEVLSPAAWCIRPVVVPARLAALEA